MINLWDMLVCRLVSVWEFRGVPGQHASIEEGTLGYRLLTTYTVRTSPGARNGYYYDFNTRLKEEYLY